MFRQQAGALWGTFENDDTSVLETGEPPLLLIHGTKDKVINLISSLAVYHRAQEAGVPVEFVPWKDHCHGLRADKKAPKSTGCPF